MADLNLVVLIENSSPDGLLREHGLSVYLEYRGCPVLLDAGESGRPSCATPLTWGWTCPKWRMPSSPTGTTTTPTA